MSAQLDGERLRTDLALNGLTDLSHLTECPAPNSLERGREGGARKFTLHIPQSLWQTSSGVPASLVRSLARRGRTDTEQRSGRLLPPLRSSGRARENPHCTEGERERGRHSPFPPSRADQNGNTEQRHRQKRERDGGRGGRHQACERAGEREGKLYTSPLINNPQGDGEGREREAISAPTACNVDDGLSLSPFTHSLFLSRSFVLAGRQAGFV